MYKIDDKFETEVLCVKQDYDLTVHICAKCLDSTGKHYFEMTDKHGVKIYLCKECYLKRIRNN